MNNRLRWKKEPRETGLRAVGAGPRGSELHDGSTRYAVASAKRTDRRVMGWYWVAGWESKVPHKNTCESPCATEEEAKAQALAYVREHLKANP